MVLAGLDENVKGIIDYATLTGAMVVALSSYSYGLLGNEHNNMEGMMIKALKEAGEITHERLQHLQVYPELHKRIRKAATHGGIRNTGPNREGGHYDGYTFLNALVSKTPHVHIDMAGAMSTDKERSYYVDARFNAPPVMASVRGIEAIAKKL